MELRIQIDFQRAVKQVISQVSSNLSMAETQVSYIRSSKTIHLNGKKQNIYFKYSNMVSTKNNIFLFYNYTACVRNGNTSSRQLGNPNERELRKEKDLR